MKTYKKFIRYWLGLLLLVPVIVLAGALADSPLSLKGSVPPNVMFALSVEFPTANTAAYQGTNDYSSGIQYLGYFDPDKCYDYDSGNGYFVPTNAWNGPTIHQCFPNFSGNFLNWATMTGLDEFRFAMTGGNRSTDTSSLTVLERSYQSGQGGTSNFPDKTWTENYTTPWPGNTPLTIQNQGKGVQMTITPNGSDTANCTVPTLSGTFSCGSIALASDGTAGSCSTYAGLGTLASPYKCTSFGSFGAATASSVTPHIVSTANSSGTSTTTANCTSPTMTGSTFSCSLALTSGSTGTCTAGWTGTGADAAHAYTCSTFGTFSGGETFSPSGGNTTSNFTTTSAGSTVVGPNVSCTVTTGAGGNTSCTWSGHTASCNSTSYLGSGSSGSPFYCPSLAFSGSEQYISSTVSTPQKIGTKWYMTNYQISYQIPVSTTRYYISAYPGTDNVGSAYYYYSTYDVAFGTAQTYNVRVKVCDNSVGLEDNCKLFGSSYKPTGSVQDNGDKMKFGVTSYFSANDIDNAVLRSKSKYVAPTKYSSSGGSIANTLKEWNAADGTLIQNPDASDSATVNSYVGTVTNTGVINYINKFGSTLHSYKTYDDMGKLYYETQKYLRGGQNPTADFYNGAKASNSDGFPVITTWDDPVQYSCQKNYIIAMGDTHTWCDKRLPGGTYAAVGNSVCNGYTDGNGHTHAADYSSFTDSGVNVTTSTNAVGALEGLGNIATTNTGAGGASFSMAGLSYWAASQSFRPNMIGDAQHLQTYIIDVQEAKDCGYQSQYWLAAKYGNPKGYDPLLHTWLTSGNPAMGTTILPASNCSSRPPSGYVAAGGSVAWPTGLLRAGDPLSMIASVKAAIADISGQIGDEAALSQSSGSLDTGTGAYIYRALYNSKGWTGDVQALTINTSGIINSTPAWKASAKLPAPGSRNIFTFNDGWTTTPGVSESTSNSRKGVAFTSSGFSNLSSSQQALLNTSEQGASDSLGSARIDWIRGDQSKETYLSNTTTANPSSYGWRARVSSPTSSDPVQILGDVVNSNPIFVSTPSILPGAGYATFYATNKGRTPMVYVGGNDGMLHAYDASFTVAANGTPVVTTNSGTEKFAYVPSAVYKNLSQLMGANYSHKYFVDGSPVVAEACFGATVPCTAATSWKTLLVGGLNAGGQGIYALDVTDPSSFDASKVLWEFTDKDDADLGYTFSKPIIRKLNDGKWAVIFGNGYNNTTADGSASTTGRAYLYILYVNGPTGIGKTWTLGTDYYKIELKSPTENSGTIMATPNGLSAVTGIDKDSNGTVDIVYAGDRDGNLWKVDLSSATPSSWGSAFTTLGVPKPLFTAVTSGGAKQQITTGIEVGKHPNGGFMVMFGTGSWIESTDSVGPFSAAADSIYGIWDKDDGATKVTSRSLLQQEQVIANVDSTGTACTAGTAGCFVIMSNCQPNYSSSAITQTATGLCANSGSISPQLGYYFDMPGVGERIRSSAPVLSGGIVTYTSLSPASDPCTGNTLGFQYSLDFLGGGAPVKPTYVIPGTTTGMITITIGGVTYQVPAAGMVTAGGATDNAVKFSLGKDAASALAPGSVPTPPPGMPSAMPTSSCSGTTCGDYIPGWGFLLNNMGATATNKLYFLSCLPPATGNGPPTCQVMTGTGQYGRLDWKQINR